MIGVEKKIIKNNTKRNNGPKWQRTFLGFYKACLNKSQRGGEGLKTATDKLQMHDTHTHTHTITITIKS